MKNKNEHSPEYFCQNLILDFKNKALHNKNESLRCFYFSMWGALLAPVFVTLGDDIANIIGYVELNIVLSKLIPSILSVSAAFSIAWLQLRKPQQLWALYRTSQRNLESHLYKYQFNAGEYTEAKNAEKIFIENITQISLNTHADWLPIIPNPDDIKKHTSEKS